MVYNRESASTAGMITRRPKYWGCTYLSSMALIREAEGLTRGQFRPNCVDAPISRHSMNNAFK